MHTSISATVTDTPDDIGKEMGRACVALKKWIISIFNKIMYLVHQEWPDGAFRPLLFLPFSPPPPHTFLGMDGRGRNCSISQVSD